MVRNQTKGFLNKPSVLSELVLRLLLSFLLRRLNHRLGLLLEVLFKDIHVFFRRKLAKLGRRRVLFDFLEPLKWSLFLRQHCLNFGQILEEDVASDVTNFAVGSGADCLLEGV